MRRASRRARVHRHAHPHRGRPARRSAAREWVAAGDHDRDRRARRRVLCATVSPKTTGVPAIPRGAARRSTRDDLDTSSVASFRAAFHRRVAVNIAYLVPHGALRLEAVRISRYTAVRTCSRGSDTCTQNGSRRRRGRPVERPQLLPMCVVRHGRTGRAGGRGAQGGFPPRDRVAVRPVRSRVRGRRDRRGDGGRAADPAPRSTSRITGRNAETAGEIEHAHGAHRSRASRRRRRHVRHLPVSDGQFVPGLPARLGAGRRPGRDPRATSRHGRARPDRRLPRARARSAGRHPARRHGVLLRPRRPALEGVTAPRDRRRSRGTLWARPSATCCSNTTFDSATASRSRSRRAAGARSGGTRSRSCRDPTRWRAPTSRRSGRCATRARSAPIRGSSAGCAARSAASRSKR